MLTAHPEYPLISELFDAQPDSVVWFTPVYEDGDTPVDFEARYCNRTAAQTLRSTPEAIVGARLLGTALMDEESRRRILEQCLQVWATNSPVEFTYYSSGLDRYFNVQRSKVHGGILSVTRDRTAEVKTELEHQRQQQHYRQILDTAADGILVFESIRNEHGDLIDFKITHANRRAIEIGALPPHTVGSTLLTILPHLAGSEQFGWHRSVAEGGGPFRFETSFRQPDGSEYGWFIVSLTQLDDGLVSNFVDVTLRKRNEQKIQEQHHLLSRIFEGSVSGMFAATALRDDTGHIVDLRMDLINKAFTQFVGFTEAEALGVRYSSLFPTAMANGLFDVFREVIEAKTIVRQENHYQGEQLDAWYDFSASPLEPDGILVSFTDISPRKHLQLELEHKLEELKRSNQSLEEFAYAASHDLQEPLRKIHFFADRLKLTLEPGSERAEMFARMESATTRMRDLIEDLLAYSRVSMLPEEVTEVSLSELLQIVLQDLERSVEESGARLHIDPLPLIRADERQMRQLWQNLLGNALKYRMEGRRPEIDVRYRICTDADRQRFQLPVEPSYFLVEVSDNGIGFEQQYAERIFQVFQRLHGRREYSGSGVGLAIARKVVSNHEGMLVAEGRPGEGATFRMFLPVSCLV
ncbi:MAG: PAS domain-containing sensor histidine kinase [Chitinophagaceae bacterium]|nr:MAG: PAS domain-containing sensor histidine kinase [Chitinophagaceae bacterium]